MKRPFALASASLFALASAACSSSDDAPGTTAATTTSTSTATSAGGAGSAGAGGASAGGASAGGMGAGGSAGACSPAPVACSDQVILGMNLQPKATKALITNDADGAGFRSHVDATAGGAFAATPDSYTYGKFTEKGLEKVDLSDEKALESADWDVAFRRYVARVNSKSSGPSCVEAAQVPGKTFDEVTSVPDKLAYHGDEYFTDAPDCMLIPDGSGLPGSPATALSGFWTYGKCVKMTHKVFVLALADGKHVKLEVESYYEPKSQEQCDTMDSVPMGSNGAANYVVRWAYLP